MRLIFPRGLGKSASRPLSAMRRVPQFGKGAGEIPADTEGKVACRDGISPSSNTAATACRTRKFDEEKIREKCYVLTICPGSARWILISVPQFFL